MSQVDGNYDCVTKSPMGDQKSVFTVNSNGDSFTGQNAGAMGSLVLGLVAGVICFFFCTTVKNALGYDDSLDVFGIHGVGGIIGSIGTGIFVAPALGGVGVADYAMGEQVWKQFVAVVVAVLWSGVGSFILYKIVDVVVGLRVTSDQEREGLDIAEHGERAYNI